MVKNIPQNRILIYIFLLGLVPFVFVLFNYYSKKDQLNDLQNTLDYIKQRAYTLEQKQALNVALRNHYRNADHFYIDKYLESITFLEPEIENLKTIIKDKNFTSDKAIEKRYAFLTGPDNRLSFVEGVVQTYPFFQETVETLAHPVEVNVDDIKKVLARIEGIKIGPFEPGPNPPQLVILDFKIDKKTSNGKGNAYTLNMKLLKREFT